MLSRHAEREIGKIAERVVRQLQGLKEGHIMTGPDSGLVSVWDEICVQVQGDKSVYWETYLQAVRSVVAGELDSVPEIDLQTIWLQSYSGEIWLQNLEAEDAWVSTKDIPWEPESVTDLVEREVLSRAGDWSNARVRGFLGM